MIAACFLSFATGFLSLSLEILWLRIITFANHTYPQSFAFVLIWYLLGIALGAYFGKLICKHYDKNIDELWKKSGIALLVSSFADLSTPWFYTITIKTKWHLICAAGLLLLTAALKAIVFPIAHHIGTTKNNKKIGRSLSSVYTANIMGATLGPLFVGFLLLSIMTTQQAFAFCATLTFLLSLFCFRHQFSIFLMSTASVFAICLISLIGLVNHHSLIAKIADPLAPISNIIENQYGIIVVYEGGIGGDIVTGGNVYDGRTNLNPLIPTNGIHRPIILAALHDHPENVLMIGLSIGSWLKMLTSFPSINKIDVVEINSGYLKAIPYYPAQSSALLDARVHLYLDDGRRWLKINPNKKYDLIIINTTYHWRAYITHLLSKEFLELAKQHMNPGGLIGYNSTWSLDVLKTATQVFKHAYLYENFVIASDVDWRVKLTNKATENKLASLSLDGKLIFPTGSNEIIWRFLNEPVKSFANLESIYKDLINRQIEVVTDRNLITEYKYGKSLL